MKTLVLADIHLKTSDHFGDQVDGKDKRTLYKIRRIEEIIKETEPDNVIFAGDVFDSSSPAEWVRFAFFAAIKGFPEVKFFFITGNHDNRHSLPAGFSEASVLKGCHVITAGKSLLFDDFLLIGYTRNDDLFKELIKEKAKFMITHREIPELVMDYEACFFGHIHKHYQQGNCYSIGSLFKITWAEENEKNYYLLFDDEKYKFIENKDLNIKTYHITDKNYPEIPEDVDFARFEIIDSIDYITSLKEEEISKNYKNKIFFKYTPTEAAIDFKEIEDPKEAVAKLLKDKNLTQEQLNFGMKFL